eukprot:6262793-Pyramimonas_sp.AAC.1
MDPERLTSEILLECLEALLGAPGAVGGRSGGPIWGSLRAVLEASGALTGQYWRRSVKQGVL